jgi:hypothetical protein
MRRSFRLARWLADLTNREVWRQPVSWVSHQEIRGLTSPARQPFCNVECTLVRASPYIPLGRNRPKRSICPRDSPRGAAMPSSRQNIRTDGSAGRRESRSLGSCLVLPCVSVDRLVETRRRQTWPSPGMRRPPCPENRAAEPTRDSFRLAIAVAVMKSSRRPSHPTEELVGVPMVVVSRHLDATNPSRRVALARLDRWSWA